MYEDRRRHAASQACEGVRRMSGGGAIVHDAELTYSIVVPRRDRLAQKRLRLYHVVHRALIDVIETSGLSPVLYHPKPDKRLPDQPFLCFERRASGDVLVGNVKICGSAQRRSAGAVLQHGSLLLARSSAAPTLLGVNDLAPRPLGPEELVEAWSERLKDRLAWNLREEPLSDAEREEMALLARQKYASADWTRKTRASG